MSKRRAARKFAGVVPVLPPADYLLFAECMVLMPVMALAVRFLPFARLKALASRQLGSAPRNQAEQEGLVSRVRWAIAAAARRSPFRAKCFEQGLVAQIVLRRRGIDSALYYGLTSGPDAPLSAHVWVRAGEFPICGTENAGQFSSLLRLPPEPSTL